MNMKLNRIVDEKNLAWEASSFSSEQDFTFTYRLSGRALSELGGTQLPGTYEEIPSKLGDFPYLKTTMLEFYRRALTEGPGFGLITGLDPTEFSRTQQDMIYWMMCNLLGEPLKQNIRGEKRVEVKDRGGTMAEGARYHQTKDGGSLHTDSPQWQNVPDLLGLLCLHPAMEGGDSKLISAYSVHNELLQRRSDLLELLYDSFHFDKRGEFKPDESPTTVAPIFTYNGKVLGFRYLGDYVRAGHDTAGKPLSVKQLEALGELDKVLEDEKLIVTMSLKAGDINFVNNHRVIHGRNGFIDYPEQNRKRLMVRAWLRERSGK